MELPHQTTVAVVDGHNFALFENAGSSAEPRLKPLERVDVDGTNFSAGVRHQDEVGQKLGRTDLDELAHAAAAAEWLNKAAIGGKISKLFVVADPKSLGEMRRHYHTKLQDALVGELDRTMTSEPPEQIAKVIASA